MLSFRFCWGEHLVAKQSIIWLRTVAFGSASVLIGAAIGAASVNAVNDSLLKQSVQQQKEILEEVIGERCRAVRVFFNGIGRTGVARGRAFWSVECSDGRRYMVMVTPNVDDTRVMRCSELKSLGIISCFKKMG